MNPFQLDRRRFVCGALAAVLAPGSRERSTLSAAEQGGPRQLFWGDLHNHNAVGYALGSLERSIELAREHLDFFAFTGHASWHDLPKMPGDRHMKWVRGFEVHSNHWPKTRKLIEDANTDDFVSFLGYEWHSSHFGDYCMIFPEDQPELFLPNHAEKLQDFAEAKGAFAIPHHVGYKQGWRGANWKHFRAATSPVVEIFSEHGCTISDRSPEPMIRHSIGGRSTRNTIAPQLKKGLRFGFVASSDNHRGYPGAYGEGLLGVWADDLSRESLFKAIRARRTYAATGDRIALEMTVNGKPMGSDVSATADRQIDVRVEGQDSIAMVELVRNGRVVERVFPEDLNAGPLKLPGRAKCRIQYGWGPWAALDLGRTALWDMTIRIDRGRFLRAVPCFQSGPFDEDLRDKLDLVSENEIRLESNTSRVKCYSEDPTKALVCEVDAQPDAVLTLKLRKPAEQTIQARLSDLIEDNVVTFTGQFTSESYIVHRLVAPSEYGATVRWVDHRPEAAGPDHYYVRVTQHNGQLAWSSPVWVG
ncbi:MAG: hypothetical protein CMJ48_03380 [Planctomycetaceae bacterium]|nr:hypothetical protein [Planctomycetaceae bacterium]